MADAVIFGILAILAFISKGQSQTLASSAPPVSDSTGAIDDGVRRWAVLAQSATRRCVLL